MFGFTISSFHILSMPSLFISPPKKKKRVLTAQNNQEQNAWVVSRPHSSFPPEISTAPLFSMKHRVFELERTTEIKFRVVSSTKTKPCMHHQMCLLNQDSHPPGVNLSRQRTPKALPTLTIGCGRSSSLYTSST